MDLLGRVVLYGLYNALVHHQRGSLPQFEVPHEVRAQQNKKTSYTQNRIRLAPVHSDEPPSVPQVFPGETIFNNFTYLYNLRITNILI